MVTALGFLIVAAVGLYIAWPLRSPLRESPVALGEDPLADLLSRRDTVYREIVDLDFDHRLGKVSGDDYQLEREEYVSEAADLLDQIDRKRAAADPSERPTPGGHDVGQESRSMPTEGQP